jgi:hypothetical protein
MNAPAPARRRIDAPATADDGGRRGCLVTGAVAGIVVGALFAFLVMPRLFDRFFGTADIALGAEYTNGGRSIRVIESRRAGNVVEVELRVRASRTWTPAPADFELEMSKGERLALLEPDATRPETSLLMPLGDERTLVLRFGGATRADSVPRKLHIDEPRVRLHLVPGEPE